jgi:hypothetical protein
MKPEQTPFHPAWLAFDLGKHRPCDGTYCYYELDKTPPLDSTLFKGEFQWLPDLSPEMKASLVIYKQTEMGEVEGKLQSILADAKAKNINLPPEFVKFMSLESLQDQIPSCTACYFDLSAEITPCPLSNDEGFLIRFLNDQQWVLLWYLYIKPSGEHCVVVSAIPFDDAEARKNLTDEIILNNTFFCAPGFEEFLYRFWLENEIWFALDGGELNPTMQDYLKFYA